MCQVYEKFMRETREKGIDIGRNEGIDIGRSEGIELERNEEVKMIQNLMKNAKVSAESAMDMLGLTEKRKQEFAAMLLQ